MYGALLELVGAEHDPRHLARCRAPGCGCVTEPMNGLSDTGCARTPCRSAACSPAGRPARTPSRPSGGGTASCTRASRSSEVLDRAVAAAAVQVAHERRAVGGREDGRVAADPARCSPGSARTGRTRAARSPGPAVAAHAPREPHALAVDVGAGAFEGRARRASPRKSIADLLEDRVGVVLDRARGPPRDRTSNGFSVRVMNGTFSATACSARGAAARAAAGRRGLGRSVAHAVLLPSVPSAPASAAAWPVRRPARRAGRPRRRAAGTAPCVRDAHRVDEVLLEPRLDRGLDLLDASDHVLDLRARRAVQQRDPRAGPRRVAGAASRFAGSQSGTSPSTIACTGSMWRAERAGQPDPVDRVDAGGPSAAGSRRRGPPSRAGSAGRRSA